jgi:hypothetical protein
LQYGGQGRFFGVLVWIHTIQGNIVCGDLEKIGYWEVEIFGNLGNLTMETTKYDH